MLDKTDFFFARAKFAFPAGLSQRFENFCEYRTGFVAQIAHVAARQTGRAVMKALPILLDFRFFGESDFILTALPMNVFTSGGSGRFLNFSACRQRQASFFHARQKREREFDLLNHFLREHEMPQAPHGFRVGNRMQEHEQPEHQRAFFFRLANQLAEKRLMRFFPFQIRDQKGQSTPLRQKSERRTRIFFHKKRNQLFAKARAGQPRRHLLRDGFRQPFAGAPFQLIAEASGEPGRAENARRIIFKTLGMQNADFLGLNLPDRRKDPTHGQNPTDSASNT